MKRFTKEERQALAKLFNEVDWSDPRQRQAIATEIVRFVVNDVYDQDVVNMIADVERFNPGETLEFHVMKELIAYVIEPGSYLPRSNVAKTAVQLPKHRVGVAVSLDIRELRSGRYGTIVDLRRKAAEALLGHRNKMVWDTIIASITSGATNYASFASTDSVSTKKSALDTAISYINDNTNNGPAAIVGRWSSLDWIEDIDATQVFSDNAKDQILNNGVIGHYKGTPIIRLRGYKDGNAKQAINANHIAVVSEGTIKFGEVNPGLEVFEDLKGTETMGWELAFWGEHGVAVVEPERNYHIEIT